MLLSAEHVKEMETALALSNDSTVAEPFVRGDLFCFADYILFLVFDDEDESYIRAGIVYEPRTAEPFRKLDAFCQEVRTLIISHDQQMAISFAGPGAIWQKDRSFYRGANEFGRRRLLYWRRRVLPM